MLETFTVETFTPFVGDTFRVFYDETSALEVTLRSAKEFGTESAREWSKASGRTPFMLHFYGQGEYYLQQGLYRVEHPQMEPFELFLVPVNPDRQGMEYEAVFT